MRIVLITLDFDSNASHAEVFEAVRGLGSWWHYMKWTWLVYTAKTVDEVQDILTPVMKSKGRMLIVEAATSLRRAPGQGRLGVGVHEASLVRLRPRLLG